MLQVLLKLPLQLRWRRGPDLPFGMECNVQSVVVQGRVYVGGWAGIADNYTVMEYDTSSGEWTVLPSYRTRDFAMTVINNQLVLVGGYEHGPYSKVLGVWRAESKEWTHPYPEMPTARSLCSAVVYTEWLAVAGGWGGGGRLSSVEVLNINSKQWYAGPPTPTPWSSMKTAIVGDTCYYMGGFTGESCVPTAEVYSVSLPALVSQLHSQDSRERGKQHQIWKEISGLQTTRSTPLSISGSLLAVGGEDKDGHAVTTIHLYQPDTEEWVKVGDLPTPRYDCTCAMITDREMLVTGGRDDLSKSDIALINTH
jgi:N-acetylneuraminic acid mutarotase